MNENILVSIITPCFNSENTIARTIESVLNQTYKYIEYIIIDGASTDTTLDIIRKYEPEFQGRMRVISEKDNGIYDAMNKGIKQANGELIGIVNSDDYYNHDSVEVIVENMLNEKHQILYGYQRNLKDDQETKVCIYHHAFLNQQMITHPTCFVTKSVYDDYGLYNCKYKSSADYEFMLRIYKQGNVLFKPVYRIISNFAEGGMSSSQLGVQETARLKLEFGIISKSRYWNIMIRSKLFDFFKKMRN
jgi:glycosyltransferase involved in cell wall biosynthesis